MSIKKYKVTLEREKTVYEEAEIEVTLDENDYYKKLKDLSLRELREELYIEIDGKLGCVGNTVHDDPDIEWEETGDQEYLNDFKVYDFKEIENVSE